MSKSLKRAERIVCSLVLMLSVFVTTVFATALYLPVSSLEKVFAEDTTSAENLVTPAKPTYTLKLTEDGKVKVTINKTSDATGYVIYVKKPGATKYVKLKTIARDGTKKRVYNYTPALNGEYAFKIKAYNTSAATKTWSKVSKIQKITVSGIDLGVKPSDLIKYKGDTQQIFTMGGNNKGETDTNPYTVEYEVDESLKDAVIKLRLVDKDGNLVSEAPANVDPNECTLFVSRLGTFYIALFAYENEDDAENHRNPIAMSEILKVKSVNEKGETGEEVVTYADITFKNGYAYFGEAPLELVTDKTLASKVIAVTADHGVREYKGDRYVYDDKDKNGVFKYVPIEWRILKKTDKYVLLMTNSIIKGGGYDGFAERSTTTWKNSCLYYMLNKQNNYKKSEITYSPVTDICDRVLITMKLGGVETKIGIPTVDLLTKAEYGFSTSKAADKNRIVKPSVYYSKTTNNNVGSYANYWVVNKTAGKAITVDKNGKINEGTYKCNVYEIGTVLVVKVNLELCNVIEK